MRPGPILTARQYELYEKFDPDTYQRTDFVRRPGARREQVFYTHGRGITVNVGRRGRLLLINDEAATKFNQVVVADLATHRNWRIDEPASSKYVEETHPNPAFIILPIACSLSPDDRQALIVMYLDYISTGSADLASRSSLAFVRKWYVVRTRDGKVLRSYGPGKPPRKWWIE